MNSRGSAIISSSTAFNCSYYLLCRVVACYIRRSCKILHLHLVNNSPTHNSSLNVKRHLAYPSVSTYAELTTWELEILLNASERQCPFREIFSTDNWELTGSLLARERCHKSPKNGEVRLYSSYGSWTIIYINDVNGWTSEQKH